MDTIVSIVTYTCYSKSIMLVPMISKFTKVPIYVIKKVHQAVRAKLIIQGRGSISAWVRQKENEELKK